jgi:glycosyltransferase involved in cell wall biosynthesis
VRRILLSEQWDVAHLWTGIGEESLRTERPTWKLSVLMRGSAHVRVQARLLEEEEHRTGAVQEKPSRWMIAREEREYAAADKICVLSTFAHETFCAEGISPEKLFVLPLGVSLRKFRAPPDVIRDRVRRIRSGAPLRVLYVGAVSFQKGFSDVAAAARVLAGHGCHFRVVGPRSPEVHELAQETRGRIDFGAKTPEAQLPSVYAWGDVFLFPTIQDGYAQVLAQAAAAGLPILTTTNCSGPELVREGENGWIVPIRRWDLIVERLQWCQQNREQLASIVYAAYERFRPRDWQAVASDFETACTKAMPKQWPAARAS